MKRLPALSKCRDVIVMCLLLLAGQQLGGAALIKAKAWLAPLLIEGAWQETLDSGGPAKPWPWADTWPVARLRAPALGIDLLVLAGDSGNALAFGPGHALASATLGSQGMAVIGGHRDTHFAFLKNLRPGHLLQLELPTGEQRNYLVRSARVVDASQESLPVSSTAASLLLVTCYPFDTLRAGGSLRYAVSALPLLAWAEARDPTDNRVYAL